MSAFFAAMRDGRLLTRERTRLWAVAMLAASVLGLGFLLATSDGLNDYQGRPLGTDFSNVYAAGNQAFTFIGNAAFSGAPGEVRYYQAGGNTYLQMQTGTSVDIEGVIRLDGIHTPEASWFVL